MNKLPSFAQATTPYGLAAFVCAAGLAALSGTAHAQAAAEAVPTITGVIANGNGCPAGTWDATITDDGQSFTIAFDTYKVAIGPQTSFALRQCQIGVQVSNPSNASYALQSFNLDGNATLSAGTNATVTAQAYFSGSPAETQTFVDEGLTGPQSRPLHEETTLEDDALLWSSCGERRDVNVATRIIVRNPAAAGSASIDLTQGQLTMRLAARSCD